MTTDSSAETSNGWIKCKENLPPYGKEVLVYMGTSIYLAERHHTDAQGEWWESPGFGTKQWNTVTHWRPLPEKPNEF